MCLGDLADAPLPSTWAEVAAQAETTCVTTSRCEPDTDAAVTVGIDACEGSLRGYYDASGDLVAAQDVSDTNTCHPDVFESWYGQVLDTCVAAEAVRSPGCARPWSPPAVDGVERVAATGEPWSEAEARLAGACHGTIACALPSARDVVVTYAYEGCGVGRYDVYDLASGHVGGGTDPDGLGVPDLDGGALDALATCLRGEFVPSEACGIATP